MHLFFIKCVTQLKTKTFAFYKLSCYLLHRSFFIASFTVKYNPLPYSFWYFYFNNKKHYYMKPLFFFLK